MSGHPPFGKHIPSLCLCMFWEETHAVLTQLTSSMVPLHPPCHTVERKESRKKKKKKDTSSLAKRHGGLSLSLSGLTSWTQHTLMYKYLPLAKVQAALCGCQTQQKTIIQGKVFTAVVAKEATASKRSHLIGRDCLWCYHKAPGHWGVPTLLVMVIFFNTQPRHN